MRTFHIGGTAQVAETSFMEATNAGVARIAGPTVVAAHGDLVAMSRNVTVTVVVDGKDRETHKAFRTAPASASRTAARSSAASVWPSGTPTPPRS